MRKHIPHPITRLASDPTFTEIDIFYGGNEKDAIEESLVIARDLREVVREGENILYVNTLVTAERLEHMLGKRFDHGVRRGRNHFVTYPTEGFILKLDAIRGIALAKDIRYLVLNSFELAALTTRHRTLFMAWIREMRNAGVNIILFTMCCPGKIGTLGALRFSARTVTEVGAYLRSASETHGQQPALTTKPTVLDVVEPIDSAEAGESAVDLPAVSKLFTGLPTKAKQHSDKDLLKTKDLAFEMV